MKWEQLKHKPETLVDMVNELGTRGVGDRFNKNKDTINHWLKKYGYEYDPSTHKWGKEGETEEEEVDLDEFEEYLNQKGKSKVSKTENGYKINKDNVEVDLSKEELKQIYYDYCELGITKKETAVKNGFILDDLEIILKTFDIVHKELPVTEEEILEKDPKQIVQQIIQNKKRKIKEMKPAEEMRYLRKLADKHLKDDYYTDRVIEELRDDLKTIKIELDDLEITYSEKDRVMVVVLSDWHYGKKVLKEQLLGDNEYNSSVFKERIDKYRKAVIEEIELRNPQKVIIVNLGDIADDPQSRTYPGQVHNQDVTGEKQVLRIKQQTVHIKQYSTYTHLITVLSALFLRFH